jgi:N-acetylglucosaminyldiphosphoundecaprenol N-acetyl-beta-D-mannosaminyltransferase
MPPIEKVNIVGLPVHHISFTDALVYVTSCAEKKVPSFICFANVHMTVEAFNHAFFANELNKARLILTDGVPLAKAFKWFYGKKQERIAGMDFMPVLLQHLNQQPHRYRVFFLGSSQEVLEAMEKKLRTDFTNIDIAGMMAPPFKKDFTDNEQAEIIRKIKSSCAQIVFVSFGCPKQELWMASSYENINAVLLGVGGAFPVFAGLQKRAPVWMQQFSLEWLYRLIKEPQRLWKRYLYTNIIFIFLLIKQLFSSLNRQT